MEQRETSISLWSRRVMEACWLLALIMIPVYFSLLSDRHFEPDKAVTLRSLALLLGGAWVINILERGASFKAWPRWRDWRRAPLVVPTLVYAGVFILTTLTSILIFTSLFGGYNRLQGTYTNLSYALIFGGIVAKVRRREQLDRIITVMIAGMFPVLAYGWVQHRAIDPLPWAGDTASRVASTMGNSIFVAAYLILVLPFVLYRLVLGLRALGGSETPWPLTLDPNAPGMPVATAREQQPTSPGRAGKILDLGWLAVLALPAIGQIALLYGMLKLGAMVQAPLIGFGHWWLFPGAVIVTGSMLPLISYRTTTSSRANWRLYLPGALILLFMLGVLIGGYPSAPFCDGGTAANQVVCLNNKLSTARHALDYGTWIGLGMLSYLLFYLAIAFMPRRTSDQPSALLGGATALVSALIAVFTVLIIIYTQSRGPQIGMFVGLFTFVTLLLIQAFRSNAARRGTFAALLAGWALLSLAALGFLVALNTTEAPAFGALRQNPYIARLGNLLDTQDGTGKVRVLIWRGDDYTRGAVGLVTDNPFRTLVGWGPETMFVAYNPFYPPALALLESRGASPDRSHQALLDELATKGALGLFSHLFLFGSFAIIMLRLLRIPRLANLAITTLFMLGIAAFFTIFLESVELGLIVGAAGLLAVGLAAFLGYARPLEQRLPFSWQLLVIACISAVVSNFVENVFGIPIVSSLLYTWVIMGVGVVGGMFGGAYQLGEPEQIAPTEVAAAEPEVAPSAGGTRKSRVQSGKRPATAGRRPSGRGQGAGPATALYPVIAILALIGIWFFNIDNIYADMRYLQAKNLTETGGYGEHILGYAALQDAIDNSPNEDLYYLTYGRALMQLAQDFSTEQPRAMREAQTAIQQAEAANNQGQANQFVSLMQQISAASAKKPDPKAALSDLPQAEYDLSLWKNTYDTFLKQYSPLQILDYARLALEAARDLNPRNKDHYANLGRLHASWFRNLQQVDPAEAKKHLDLAIFNYEEAHRVAPQDVELTGQMAMLYQYPEGTLDKGAAALAEATKLDPVYPLNRARYGEIKRKQGDLLGAAQEFAAALATNPRIFDQTLDVAEVGGEREQRFRDILAAMQGNPPALELFLAGYRQALEKAPENLGYHQVFTQVLSDTQQYPQGAEQAEQALGKAQAQNQPTLVQTFQNYLTYFRSRLASS